MSELRRILIPVDFSEQAATAIHYGCQLARSSGAELYLLHVVQDLTPIGIGNGGVSVKAAADYADEVERRAAQSLAQVPASPQSEGLTIFRQTTIGSPWQDIVEFARSNNVDLICLGTHGRSGFKRMMLGSVAEKVVQHAPCHVLVVRELKSPSVPANQVPSAFRRVLVPTDFSASSELAVAEAAAWAARFGSELHLLHVVEDNSPSVAEISLSYPVFQSYYHELLRNGEKQLSTVLAPEVPSDRQRRQVQVGDPITKINEYATASGIDLIVMGTHGRKGPSHWLLGSVAERVVRSAPCPVLVARPPRQSQPAGAGENAAAATPTA